MLAKIVSLFTGVSSTVWVVLGSVIAAGAVAFSLYHAGLQSARADEAINIAANNARVAARSQANAVAAQIASAAASERLTKIQDENAKLKEAVNAAAKGNASPGCLAAVHGLQPHGSKAPAGKLPGRPK